MDKKRGIMIVGGSFALLVAGVALTAWAKKARDLALAEATEKKNAEERKRATTKATTAKRKPRREPHANGKVVGST